MPMLSSNSFSDYLANPQVTEILVQNLKDFCLPATHKSADSDSNHGVGSLSRIFNNLKISYPKHEALAELYEDLLSKDEGQGPDNGNWVALLVATGYNDLFDMEGKLKAEIKSLLNQKLSSNEQTGVIDSLYSVYGEELVNANILSSYILNAYEVLFNKKSLLQQLETVTFLSQQSNALVNTLKKVNKEEVTAANDVLVAIVSKVNNQSLKSAIYEFNNERLKGLDATRAAVQSVVASQPVTPPTVVSSDGAVDVRLNNEIEKNKVAEKTIADNTEQLAAQKIAYDKLKEDSNAANLKLQGDLNEVKKVRDRALYKKVNAKLDIVKNELTMLKQEVLSALQKQGIELSSLPTIATHLVTDPTSQYHRDLNSVTKKALRQYYSIEKLQEALKKGDNPIEQSRSLIKEYTAPVDGKSHQDILEMGLNHPFVTAMKVLLAIVSAGIAYAAGIFSTSGERLADKMQFFKPENIDKQENSIKEILTGPSSS